ncbi:MAG TPA: hypothetical protein VGM69_10380 [Chloroflexota bacterium]
MVGFWQIALIAYILFLAIGPRRVVRWIRVAGAFNDRMRGRPVQARAKPSGLLRWIGLFEYSTPVGWACVALGLGLLVLDGICRSGACGVYGPLVLLLAMLLFFLAPWLI